MVTFRELIETSYRDVSKDKIYKEIEKYLDIITNGGTGTGYKSIKTDKNGVRITLNKNDSADDLFDYITSDGDLTAKKLNKLINQLAMEIGIDSKTNALVISKG